MQARSSALLSEIVDVVLRLVAAANPSFISYLNKLDDDAGGVLINAPALRF
jgi:hypothetical protein